MLELVEKSAKAYEELFGEKAKIIHNFWKDERGNMFMEFYTLIGSSWVTIARVERKQRETILWAYYPSPFPIAVHGDRVRKEEFNSIPKMVATLAWAWKYILCFLPHNQVKILKGGISKDRKTYEISLQFKEYMRISVSTPLCDDNLLPSVSLSVNNSQPLKFSPQHFAANLYRLVYPSAVLSEI